MERGTLRVLEGVPGPAGEAGFLLMAPPSEVLDWDVQSEIASTCRHWMADRQAWWIAAPYRTTALQILERLDPPPEPAWRRLGGARLAAALRVRWATVLGAGSTLRGSADRV